MTARGGFQKSLTYSSVLVGIIVSAVSVPSLSQAANDFQGRRTPVLVSSEPRLPDVVRNLRLHGQEPLPDPTVISQIHNAPGWRHSHTYTYREGPYTRVVSGRGWNEASGTYVPGEALNAYQLTSRGSCTSGNSKGPTGTGGSISDGTCTWKYLSRVDYISITGWAFDNEHWKRGAKYRYGDYVVAGAPLRAYEQTNLAGCRSTVVPSGTASGSGTTFMTPDGCQWKYWADVLYSSERSHIPTQSYRQPGKIKATYEMKANYAAELWNDREYVAGRNGEAVPIRLQAHFDYTQDGFPYSAEGDGITCNPKCYRLIVMAAPGESFADKLKGSDPLAAYNPKNGVAIRNPTVRLTDGFSMRDKYVDLIGLQVKSDRGIGVGGGQTHGGGYATIRDSIIEGGSEPNSAAINLNASALVENSLVIAHGQHGIVQHYVGTVLHVTLVNPDRVPNSVGIQVGPNAIYSGETISNTAIFGFAHGVGTTADPNATNWRGTTWLGGDNATSAKVGDNGVFVLRRRRKLTIKILPNTTYGIPTKTVFRAFPGDYRLSDTSPLIGAGKALGAFDPACIKKKGCVAKFNFDSPDIIGTSRPQHGRYDIGAWQSCGLGSRDCER